MPKLFGDGAGELYRGEPSDEVGQALWNNALQGLEDRSLHPIADYLRSGYAISGLLAEELATAIEAGLVGFLPEPVPANPDPNKVLWAKVGAFCRVRISSKPRGWAERIYHDAATRFPEIGSPRTARRAADMWPADMWSAGHVTEQPFGLDLVALIAIWGAALTEYHSEQRGNCEN